MANENDGEPLEIIEFDQSLDEVEKPPELPNGVYEGEVQDIKENVSQGKGNKYYAIQVRIKPESIPSNMAEFFEDGAVLTYNRQLVPNGKDRRILYNLRKLLENLDMPTQGTTSFDPNELMGRECRVRIKQSAYQGEMRAGIQEFVAVTGNVAPVTKRGAGKPVEEEEQVEEAKPAPRKAARR